MRQPFTVTVEREHGNSGDVITTIRDRDGNQRKIACPGDCSPYTALIGIRDHLEEAINEPTEPKPGQPFCVTDRETGDVSVLIDSVEMGRVENAFGRREQMRVEAQKALETMPPPVTAEPETVDELIAASKPSAGDA